MLNKPLLSIIIPVAPNRCDRLTAILSRLTLSKRIFPDHTFEVVVLDGGATDETKALCEQMAEVLSLKYVYVPICQFINAAYPRNIALRLCEGKVISMIDIDHWPSETIVYGMLNPFIDDSKFRVVAITDQGDVESTIEDVAKNNPELLNGQYVEGEHRVLNRGYVVDSSKSHLPLYNQEIPNHLLSDVAMNFQILDVYEKGQIPFGINNTLWIWAALREDVIGLNGYDEIYCRQFAYSREDDDWRERIKAQVTGIMQFCPSQGFFDGQNKNFCAIHLWHEAACRTGATNKLNQEYYPRVCQPVRSVKRNEGWPWGKLLDYSYAVIEGDVLDPLDLEGWIKYNVPDMPNYDRTFSDIDKYMEELENYVEQ